MPPFLEMELSQDQVEEIRKKYKFKAGARVWEQEGEYFVFFSSVFYEGRKIVRKEIHCFWYDDEDGDYYSFLPLIRIIDEEGINEINDLLENLGCEDSSESYKESSSSDEELELLLDGVLIDDEEYEVEEGNFEERIKFDPKYFDIEEEVKIILLLEKQGFPKGEYQVGFKHYQLEKIVVREARYKGTFAFFVVKNNKPNLYTRGSDSGREMLDSYLRNRDYYSFFGTRVPKERDWNIKNVESGIKAKRVLSLIHL
jgi:hypothetical protein